MLDRVFPVPIRGDRHPVITQEYKPVVHLGVDIMYPWMHGDGENPPNAAGHHNFYMGDDWDCIAVCDGVAYVFDIPTGLMVRLVHPTGYYSNYCHLSKVHIKSGTKVKIGQPLGWIGGNPHDLPDKTKHLHYEIRTLRDHKPYNPEIWINEWQRLSLD